VTLINVAATLAVWRIVTGNQTCPNTIQLRLEFCMVAQSHGEVLQYIYIPFENIPLQLGPKLDCDQNISNRTWNKETAINL
jgi:hypothetical protein